MTLPTFPSFPTGMEILFRSEESLSRSVNGTEGGGGIWAKVGVGGWGRLFIPDVSSW